jgi:WD40 repeat protein
MMMKEKLKKVIKHFFDRINPLLFQNQQLNHTGGHRGRVNSVSFSPCSRFLATAGEDGLVNIWDTNLVNDDVDDLSNMLNYSDMMGKNSGSASMGF